VAAVRFANNLGQGGFGHAVARDINRVFRRWLFSAVILVVSF
jgi:hypothetical protein